MRRIEVIVTIASKELADGLRNRWVWTVALLLLASALAIAFFGAVPAGVAGLRGGGAIMASLLNLSAYLVPLLALILGSGAIIEEKRRGTLDLVLTHPLSPGEYFYGTFLGYAAALAVALVGSFVPTGVVLRLTTGIDIAEYSLLLYLVVLLGGAFLALAFLVSILARDRSRSVASSVLVWILAVLLFDLVLVGLLTLYPGQIPTGLFGFLLLLNPSDVFRLVCFQWIGSAASPLGLATVMPAFPTWALLALLLAWILAPLSLAQLIFRRRVLLDTLA